jgi:hypothetical protein
MAATEVQIRAMFLPYGSVQSFERPVNDHTFRPGPIAYVEMTRDCGAAAIQALNGTQLGRAVVSVAIAGTPSTWTPPAARIAGPERPRRTITPRGLREPRRPS